MTIIKGIWFDESGDFLEKLLGDYKLKSERSSLTSQWETLFLSSLGLRGSDPHRIVRHTEIMRDCKILLSS